MSALALAGGAAAASVPCRAHEGRGAHHAAGGAVTDPRHPAMLVVMTAATVELPDGDAVRKLHRQPVLVHAHALDEVAALDAHLLLVCCEVLVVVFVVCLFVCLFII